MTGLSSPLPPWLETGQAHVWLPYTQMRQAGPALPVVAAEGVELELADGRRLIDGIASWWSVVHGYRHPHIVEAVRAQAARLPHVMLGGLANEPAYTLATRLAALLPGDLNHVFFSDSGSVGVEVAMKMATQYWLNAGRRRTRFVCFRGGYHGDTFATMSVCDPEEGMHALFRGSLIEQVVADLPRTDEQADALEALIARDRDTLAAIVVEPLVQGAGGMVFHDAAVLRRLHRIARAHDLLLIFDEVFVGFGRLGGAFACEMAGVQPDIIVLSKALSGGTLPLAATIASTRVYEGFLSDSPGAALMHGPTYMGNALACAAANASLDLFEREPRLAQARAIGATLEALLAPARAIAGVVDVRVCGAIGVIQFDRTADAAFLTSHCVARGVWLRPFRDILYTTPPLVIGQADLARVAEVAVEAADAWANARKG